jgi:hypothetical protein
MNRRSFLSAVLAGVSTYIVSRLPWEPYGAVFKVVKVDPDCSGMELSGHLGMYVYNAKRCCKNCTIIFGAFVPGGDISDGPFFSYSELEPINQPAKEIVEAITEMELKRSKWVGSTESFYMAT